MPLDTSRALHRFGLGPRAGDLKIVGPDPRAALAAEIERPGIALLSGAALPDTVTALSEILRVAGQRREMIQAGKVPSTADAQNDPGMGDAAEKMDPADKMDPAEKMDDPSSEPAAAPNPRANARQSGLPPAAQLQIYQDEVAARLDRVRSTELGFVERLVSFWTNHFAVAAGRGGILFGLVGAFEREAIRPHVLGRFEDMLVAATKHPAMLLYLNNAQSIGPTSPAGKRFRRGLNENHARELLELHTIGVDGGYSQADVTAFARVLTGWTFGKNERQPQEVGHFVFRKPFHEPGAQVVMGVRYADTGIGQGEAVLADLARNPATAHHLSVKLARHFVADNPSDSLVARLQKAFTDSDGSLKAMALALLDAEEAWVEPTKLKSPQEFLWSSARSLDLSFAPKAAIQAMRALGQPFWNPPSPQGFSDDSSTWLAADAISDRLDLALRWAQNAKSVEAPIALAEQVLGPNVSKDTRNTIVAAESPTQGMALLLMSAEFQRR